MKIVRKDLSELYTPERNIRKHTDKQIAEYIRSLEMFGQIKPIVIDEAGEIIAGNGLYMALLQMGATECDCYVLSGLSGNQKKKLMLADNRVYELGITDMDAFEAIIKDLGGDIDIPGWDDDLLAMINAAVQDVDEVISDYGIFDEKDIEKLAKHSSPAPTDNHSHQTSSAKEAATETSTEKSDIHKVVVCPKCGEQICL